MHHSKNNVLVEICLSYIWFISPSIRSICLSLTLTSETKAAPDDKGYNLQDNKDDMQVIDDVGASDGSVHHDDDILSRHSGSDFENMSSVSGSFSRSGSPLSDRSWSRSRSVSGGSSGTFILNDIFLN